MQYLIEKIEQINNSVNNFVWGPVMLAFFLLVGLLFTLRTGFFQIRQFRLWIGETLVSIFKRREVRKTNDKKAISQFQALSTALAATVGTGNIAGVATAIVLGGPGAVLWMWVSAFLGMMTNFAENVLGIHYRYKNQKGDWAGGPMVYIERGLKCKWLAVVFSIFCLLASFGIGNMTQINSISSALHDSFSIPPIVTGIVVAVFIALVILGGIKRIASVTEKIVPFMVLLYFAGGIACIFANIVEVPGAFKMIFTEAFGFRSAAGGVAGYGIMMAMRRGISRGVFSNEAGLGSSVMVHSASDVKEPVVQGMWGIFEVFADTMVVCTITALVILTSGAYDYAAYSDYALDKNVKMEAIQADCAAALQALTAEETGMQSAIDILDEHMSRIILECNAGETNDGKIKVYNASAVFDAMTVSAGQVVKRADDSQLDAFLKSAAQRKERYLSGISEISVKNGVPLTNAAFAETFGNAGKMFVSIAIMLFAFSTILGWSYYGERSVEYLFGLKAIPIYKLIFTAFIIIGSVSSLNLVWDISDTFNGLMALPNLIAVTLLSGQVVKITRDYMRRRRQGRLEDSL